MEVLMRLFLTSDAFLLALQVNVIRRTRASTKWIRRPLTGRASAKSNSWRAVRKCCKATANCGARSNASRVNGSDRSVQLMEVTRWIAFLSIGLRVKCRQKPLVDHSTTPASGNEPNVLSNEPFAPIAAQWSRSFVPLLLALLLCTQPFEIHLFICSLRPSCLHRMARVGPSRWHFSGQYLPFEVSISRSAAFCLAPTIQIELCCIWTDDTQHFPLEIECLVRKRSLPAAAESLSIARTECWQRDPLLSRSPQTSGGNKSLTVSNLIQQSCTHSGPYFLNVK